MCHNCCFRHEVIKRDSSRAWIIHSEDLRVKDKGIGKSRVSFRNVVSVVCSGHQDILLFSCPLPVSSKSSIYMCGRTLHDILYLKVLLYAVQIKFPVRKHSLPSETFFPLARGSYSKRGPQNLIFSRVTSGSRI